MVPMCFDPGTRLPHKKPGISVTVNVSPPKSRGEIRLATPDNGSVLLPDSLFSGGQLGGLLKFRGETLNAAREQLGGIPAADQRMAMFLQNRP